MILAALSAKHVIRPLKNQSYLAMFQEIFVPQPEHPNIEDV
jgi:hypothetical protein